MKKIGLLSFVLASFITSSFACEGEGCVDKNVYVNVETKPGAELLDSELEYKEYLANKLKKTAEDEARIAQLNKNCDDISLLKVAVAKLIKEMDGVKNRVIPEDKTNEITALEERIKKLEEAKEKESSLKKVIDDELDKVCSTVKTRVVNEELLKRSYLKMKSKKFSVIDENSIFVYKYPILGEEPIGKIMKGESFESSLYTKGGWIFVDGKGWVKGYLLTPKFYGDVKKGAPYNPSVYIEKNIVACDKK